MKANELEIGDYCRCGSTLVRVTRISETSASGVDLDALEGIEVTVEILEANGWADGKRPGRMERWINDGSMLEYRAPENLLLRWAGSDEGEYASFQCRCQYVHQVQNALRVCGLPDMADGFSVWAFAEGKPDMYSVAGWAEKSGFDVLLLRMLENDFDGDVEEFVSIENPETRDYTLLEVWNQLPEDRRGGYGFDDVKGYAEEFCVSATPDMVSPDGVALRWLKLVGWDKMRETLSARDAYYSLPDYLCIYDADDLARVDVRSKLILKRAEIPSGVYASETDGAKREGGGRTVVGSVGSGPSSAPIKLTLEAKAWLESAFGEGNNKNKARRK